MLKVLRGDPTREELAAAIVAIQARRAAVGAAVPQDGNLSATRWASRTFALRPVPHPAPAAWRTSAWALRTS
jgi:hypothetical protein